MDRETPPVRLEPREPPRSAIVWLHGLGADGHDFEPLAEQLRLPEALGVRYVFPHAAPRPVTVNGGMVMRAWYDILEIELGRRVDEAAIEASVAAVTELVEREIESGIPAERLVLAGFSQGGVIALNAGLRMPVRLAGVIGLSSYLPGGEALAARRDPANAATPVFLGHGRHDPVVPLALGQAARDAIAGFGNPLTWREYPMEHAVCMDEIDDLRGWLGDVLGR
ncbi:MAG: carboxylesterase [Gammaproteobacteria bacterium]|nr:carboxylesterase [Gammaproteobacteria bacterium]